MSEFVHNTFAQFEKGTFNNTQATSYNKGELKLLSDLEDTFSLPSLDSSKWTSGNWAEDCKAVIINGTAVVSNAYLKSKLAFSPVGKTLSARLKFTPNVANQHFGISPDLSSSWFIFSVPNSDQKNLYARSNFKGMQFEDKLDMVDLKEMHTFQISFEMGKVLYLVDGKIVAVHNIEVSESMLVWLSSADLEGQLQADWIRFDNFHSSGSFESAPFDAGTTVNWIGLSWSGELNGGEIKSQGRSSNNGINWTEWSNPSSNSYQLLSIPPGRYLQYKITLTTTANTNSPVLTSVTVSYSPP